MILVVGARGCLGAAVSRRLLARRLPTRVASRQPESLGALVACGAQAVRADLLHPKTLATACDGVDTVFAAAHGLLGRGDNCSEAVDRDGHLALIDAARAAGVQRFIYTSVLAAAPDHPVDFWRSKFAVERHLEASGMAFTILRPSAFMEVHAHQLIGEAVLAGARVRLLGHGTKPRNFVAVNDVAGLAVRALAGEGLVGRTLAIGGPDNLSNRAVATLYGELSGRPVRVASLPPLLLRAMVPVVSRIHPGVARLFTMHALADDAFDETFDPAALLAEFPGRLTSLREFVAARVTASQTH